MFIGVTIALEPPPSLVFGENLMGPASLCITANASALQRNVAVNILFDDTRNVFASVGELTIPKHDILKIYFFLLYSLILYLVR